MNLLVALAYAAAGRLALLLAVPPGYATAIWPAAGIALIAAMTGRWRYLPGIWLGSVLTNTQLTAIDAHAFTVNAVIGAGAAAQALASAELIRRTVGTPSPLDNPRSIFIFLLMAGPLGCLISATVGTSTLLQIGALEPGNFAFNWMTWWIGDALGAMLIGVSLLVFYGQPREIWQRRQKMVLATAGISALLLVSGYLGASRLELQRQQNEFGRRAAGLQIQLQAAFDEAIGNFAGLRGLLRTRPALGRQAFEAFAAELIREHPGLQAVSWNPLVPQGAGEAFEAGLQAEGLDDYRIHRHEQAPAAATPHVPVAYIFPLEENRKALGFDLNSEPRRRAALTRAATERRPVATDPIDLVQELGSQKGVVIFDAQHDQQGLLGYFSVVLRLGTLTRTALQGSDIGGLRVALVGTPGAGEEAALAVYPPATVVAETEHFSALLPVELASQRWWMEVRVSQEFLVQTRSLLPWSLLVGGLLFSILLIAFLLTVSGDAYRQSLSNRELRAALRRLSEANEELENTQTQLMDSRKFAALGSTVAGVAHELNTPVGNSITALSICPAELAELQRTLESGELTRSGAERAFSRLGEALGIAEQGLKKAAELIRTFKMVSADQTSEDIRLIKLNEYLASVLRYLRPQFQSTPHQVELQVDEEIWLETSPGGLSQVITNLLTNSLRYAFVEGQSGKILITASPAATGGASICVSDDGVGIPTEHQKRIFEPFFTTGRDIGGTGLGLHLVQDIVTHRLKGEITLVSEAGAGCRFEILLPAAISSGGGIAAAG